MASGLWREKYSPILCSFYKPTDTCMPPYWDFCPTARSCLLQYWWQWLKYNFGQQLYPRKRKGIQLWANSASWLKLVLLPHAQDEASTLYLVPMSLSTHCWVQSLNLPFKHREHSRQPHLAVGWRVGYSQHRWSYKADPHGMAMTSACPKQLKDAPVFVERSEQPGRLHLGYT